MKVYLHHQDECSAVSLERGLECCVLADLAQAACLAFGFQHDRYSVSFRPARVTGSAAPLDAGMRLGLACAQPVNADGFQVDFAPLDAAGQLELQPPSLATRADPDGTDLTEASQNKQESLRASEAAATTHRVLGRCSGCRAEFSFPASDRLAACPECRALNRLVDTIDKQAECSKCRRLMFQYAGTLGLVCVGCGERSRVGVCGECGVEYVFREREAVPFRDLPCADPNCHARTPIDWNAKVDPISRKLLVPEQTVAPLVVPGNVGPGQATSPAGARFHVVIQFYRGSNTTRRQRELERALATNLCNPLIQTVHMFVEAVDEAYVEQQFGPFLVAGRLKFATPRLVLGRRLTFETAFAYSCTELTGQLCVIANTDICFDSTLVHVGSDMHNKMYALSRYENSPGDEALGTEPTITFNKFLAPMSQDAWLFKADFDQSFRSFVDLDFELGRMGTDNRIVYEFERAGVQLSNPCNVISIHHLHEHRDLDAQRTEVERNSVPGPYKLLPPI